MNILRDGVAVLPKGTTNLYIYLTNTRLAYSDITEYEFWMEGLNKEWSKLKRGENRIAFENLDGGNYKLHLRCRNNYSWGPETVIKVTVSLPIWETGWFRLGLIFTVFAAAIIALVLRNKALRININKQELEIEKAHLLLEKENLKEEVATKDVQLLASSVQYAQKNELFNEIRTMLHTLRTENSNNTAPTLRRLINVIEGEIKGEDEWESFKYYFDKINLDFSEKLLKIEPTLTPNDIRMAMLVRLNISTKEIAKLLNITPMGVQKSKYRLKKRLGLEEKDDLKEYLLSFDSQE
jgi:DNA-binding CsgD family transcriptional regulator